MKALLILLATAVLGLGCYLPPAEGVLLFRRDTLTLDANRQTLLAKDLVALATRQEALDDARQRRATAQLLALAANLDPASKSPQNLNRTYAEEDEGFVPTSFDFEKSLSNLSSVLVYLLGEDATKQEQAIGGLLLDPLVVVAPDLSLVSARNPNRESPRWHRVVAPLDQFEEQPEVDSSPSVEPEMTGEQEGEEESAGEPGKVFEVSDFEGSITVPVFLGERISNEEYRIYELLEPLRFSARLKRDWGKVSPPVARNSQTLPVITARVKENLERKYSPEIVQRIEGNFRVGKADYLDRNGLTFSLPMMILAEGFLSERQPLENLLVLGELTSEGTVSAPAVPWPFLNLILQSEQKAPRRILVSQEMRPQMEALLTLQKEDFFFENDVFQVKTLDDVYELAFEGAESERASEALAQLREIRRVGAGKTTSVFVANPHVLARLAEARTMDARLLSATMLEMRGSSNQPVNHPTEVLASLMQAALAPLAKVPYSNSRDLKARSLEEIHSDCRAALDPLARYVALGDRKLYDKGLDLANRIRTLARAKERYEEEENQSEESYSVSLFFSTFRGIQKEYLELATEVAGILGQEAPRDPNAPKVED